jgi:hypothetical protein
LSSERKHDLQFDLEHGRAWENYYLRQLYVSLPRTQRRADKPSNRNESRSFAAGEISAKTGVSRHPREVDRLASRHI